MFESRRLAVKKKLFEISKVQQKDIDFAAVNKPQDEKQLVFTVMKKKIKYDNEDAFIIYFKDVTFGVLYEQIKA